VTGTVALPDLSVEVSGSVGFVVADSIGADPMRLLRDADLAMYAAKSTGGATVTRFDHSLSREAEHRARIEAALRRTIAGTDGAFALAWQPIVDAHGQEAGREALLRWWHESRWFAPGEFVTIADDAGLLGPIGDIVLHRACAALVRWGGVGVGVGDETMAAVNVAGTQLARADFADSVAAAIHEHGIDPAQLCLEVTEESLSERTPSATDTLNALAALGVRLSIDDFGTGATSIAQLRRLPFHYVKLDRSFLADVDRDPHEARLVSDLVQLIHGIGRVVIVEGVETAAEEAVARDAGADLYQGYRYGYPTLEGADEMALITSRSTSCRGGEGRTPRS
jgi:predicted signal transduction protein with EAL and GGDEF domain